MERIFQIIAAVLLGVAAFFFWKGNKDSAFVSGALGCVSFLISTRFQVKERMEKYNSERLEMETRAKNFMVEDLESVETAEDNLGKDRERQISKDL